MSRHVVLTVLGFALVALGGCGPSYHPVSGVVKLDGAPVAGATVSLVSGDGVKTYTGFTDPSGGFTIASGPKPGAIAGDYKVTVTKVLPPEGGESMTAGSPEYMKHMLKEAKEAAKSAAPMTPMPGMKSGMMKGVKAKDDNVLPAVYASTTSTPLTAKVPVDGGQLVLDLKGDGKKK